MANLNRRVLAACCLVAVAATAIAIAGARLDPSNSGAAAPTARMVPRLTGSGQLLVVSANLHMTGCRARPGGKDRCAGGKGVRSADQPIVDRRRHFAKRLQVLSRRGLGQGEWHDGMEFMPDVLVLQEVGFDTEAGYNDVRGVRRQIEDVTGVSYETAMAFDRADDRYVPYTMSDGSEIQRVFSGSSAILYNSAELGSPLATGKVVNRWPPEEDGLRLFCETNGHGGRGDRCKFQHQGAQPWAAFLENDDADPTTDEAIVIVASVHLSHSSNFSEEARDRDRDEIYRRAWVTQIADKLNEVGDRMAADHPDHPIEFVIGGDFNDRRCPRREEPTRLRGTDPNIRERAPECPNPHGEEPFWRRLVYRKGYTDAVFVEHDRSNRTITKQYRDGWNPELDEPNYRNQRVDMIFARGATIVASSHDVSCGYHPSRGIESNCDYDGPDGDRAPESPDRYSDHSLLWTLLKVSS